MMRAWLARGEIRLGCGMWLSPAMDSSTGALALASAKCLKQTWCTMYVPSHFKEDRVAVLHETIRGIAFGSLITIGSDGLEASHIPLLIDPEPAPYGTLRGHIARSNPQWKRAGKDGEALVTFLGPNAYVTPSWFPTKRETGKVVPTWNYLAIHAYGVPRFFEDRAPLLEIVTRLTETHESSRAAPWAVTDAPASHIDALLKAIIGFELPIARLEGKWKLSQNKSAADIAGVRDGHRAEPGEDHAALAQAMSDI
jgi:transcriptional regulator